MNKGKNQNSILVLATLGVYLGLVLAGATPQVLAQAAMTRQFNVKDEIAAKEDLDDGPNGLFEEYADAVRFFIMVTNDAANRTTINKDVLHSDFRAFLFGDATGNYDHFNVGSSRAKFVENEPNTIFKNLFEGFRHSTENDKKEFRIELSFESGFVNFGLSFHPHTPISTHTCNVYLPVNTTKIEAEFQKIVLDHTSCIAANDQVTIITRLPRGSIDSLLASDAK